MAHRHPPLGWDQIRAWAADNKVPDGALVDVKDNSGRHIPVTGLADGVIQTAFGQPAMTWAELAEQAPQDITWPWVLAGGDLYRIRDLGLWAEDTGDPGCLVLQTRWG